MKKIINILAVLILITTAGCKKKFDDLYKDPNRPEQTPASLVLNGILNDMYQRPWGDVQRWNQFNCCNYNYYGNQEYAWTSTGLNYTTLKNVMKMEEEALRTGSPAQNAYSALGKFFRAFFFYQMSMKTGDLPMTDALQSLSNPTPKYNSQKEIFKQIIKWLDDANDELAVVISKGNNTLLGDFYFNNDPRAWQKVVNAFKLRVFISLSKKETDTDLNIKVKFAEVLNNATKYPLPGSMNDNLQYVYNSNFNKYPTSRDNYGFDATRYNMAATHLNTLAQLNDPRVFVVAEPAARRLALGALPTDYDAFVGAPSAEDLGDMSTKALNGEYSFINRKRYYSTYTAENCIQIGYPEMCFNIAEAINRGWVAGDAGDWYKKGIMASIAFYGIVNGSNTFSFQKPNGALDEYNTYTKNIDLNAYYNQPSVQYAGNNATGLNQILTQKYLAFFQNSGWEAYFNYRRTGAPVFSKNGAGNGNSNRIPKRFQYPASERATNGANLTSALQSQYSGADDINAEMWIIK
jgi:Starch-binding associating with outer membrane